MQNNQFEVSENKGWLPYAPIVLLRDVAKRWLLILVAAVTIGVAAYIFADQSYVPVYRTESTLVITNRSSTPTVFSNLKSTKELAAVFSGLLNSSTLQKVVLEDTGMESMDCRISASVIEETNLMKLRVESADPRAAFLVINSLIDNHEVVTYEVIGDVVVEVLQRPAIPDTPVNTADNASVVRVAFLLAALGTAGAILAYSYFRDSVRSRQEAEQKLDCWCLGEIHHEKKHRTITDIVKRRKSSLVMTNPDVSFRFVETIRKIRRRVEQYMEGRKVLMVTSVMENEGKSTIAVNLALSLAQKQKRVLLIDLDLRKPACHKILGLRNKTYGTSDVIEGRAELAQAIVKDPLSGLDLLLERSADSSPNKITALIISGKVSQVIAEARKTYDYVILDLPPMSATPDTEYILKNADAALLVVQQNKVRAKALNRAVSVLDRGDAKLLGCVLNNVYSSGIAFESSGGYGYGYGKYGAYGK